MTAKIRLITAIACNASAEELKQSLVLELKAIDSDLAVDELTRRKTADKPAIVDIAIEKRSGEALVTLSQNEPAPFTVIHHVVLYCATMFFVFSVTVWAGVIIPLVLFGQWMLDAEAPFKEHQLAASLANLKARFERSRISVGNELEEPRKMEQKAEGEKLENEHQTPESEPLETKGKEVQSSVTMGFRDRPSARVLGAFLVLLTIGGVPFAGGPGVLAYVAAIVFAFWPLPAVRVMRYLYIVCVVLLLLQFGEAGVAAFQGRRSPFGAFYFMVVAAVGILGIRYFRRLEPSAVP